MRAKDSQWKPLFLPLEINWPDISRKNWNYYLKMILGENSLNQNNEIFSKKIFYPREENLKVQTKSFACCAPNGKFLSLERITNSSGHKIKYLSHLITWKGNFLLKLTDCVNSSKFENKIGDKKSAFQNVKQLVID